MKARTKGAMKGAQDESQGMIGERCNETEVMHDAGRGKAKACVRHGLGLCVCGLRVRVRVCATRLLNSSQLLSPSLYF